MTAIRTYLNPDGSATLRDNYGGEVHVDTFECDDCGIPTSFAELYEILAPRPSTGVQCAVLWFCRTCGIANHADRHTAECDHE